MTNTQRFEQVKHKARGLILAQSIVVKNETDEEGLVTGSYNEAQQLIVMRDGSIFVQIIKNPVLKISDIPNNNAEVSRVDVTFDELPEALQVIVITALENNARVPVVADVGAALA